MFIVICDNDDDDDDDYDDNDDDDPGVGYAAWQHDRSQDELLLTTQEAQQRDPQGEC